MPSFPDNEYWDSVEELFSGRDGVGWSAGSSAGRNVRNFLRIFRVRVKVKKMAAQSICRAPGIPEPYTPYLVQINEQEAIQVEDEETGELTWEWDEDFEAEYEEDVNCLLVEISARPEYQDDWQNWIVTCRYSTELPPGGPPRDKETGEFIELEGTEDNDPTLDPPDVSWGEESMRIPMHYDVDGFPVVNSAGMPLVPVPMVEVAYNVLTFTHNLALDDFDPAWAVRFAYAVNKNPFYGFAAGRVQCMPILAKLETVGRVYYWRATYRLKFFPTWRFDNDLFTKYVSEDTTQNYRSWQPQFLDIGQYRWETDVEQPDYTKKKQKPIYKGDMPVRHPVLLDGSGQAAKPVKGVYLGALGDTGAPVSVPFVPPYFLEYKAYPAEDFSDLVSDWGAYYRNIIFGEEAVLNPEPEE